jgi:Zn ribbon nucleic-acid-binding protein
MIETKATLTCPACGHKAEMDMPEDRCVMIHNCESCGVTLEPKPGDCCVFCSYADKQCPPMQKHAQGEDCG